MTISRSPVLESLSERFREKRDVRLRHLIDSLARGGPVSILDVGGRPEYWLRVGVPFLKERGVTITVSNLHPSEMSDAHNAHGIFSLAVDNACALPYEDGQFDLVHSNSVIEHVETWKNMRDFAAETRRVGRSYYVQTPYFWCPIDPHYSKFPFFHWLPRPVRARLLEQLPLARVGRIRGIDRSFEIVDAARLLDGRQFRFLFPDAQVSYERVAGLPKSLIAIRANRS